MSTVFFVCSDHSSQQLRHQHTSCNILSNLKLIDGHSIQNEVQGTQTISDCELF